MSSESKIRVLVVDDSAVARMMIKEGLSKDPSIEVVGTASDAYMARDKIVKLRPDVMTLDVEMPKMDGVSFLKKLMPQWPIPTIMVSSHTERGQHIALRALEAGAVEIVTKPSAEKNRSPKTMLLELRTIIKSAKRIKVMTPKKVSTQEPKKVLPNAFIANGKPVFIVIGASTGGTEALKVVLTKLPPNAPPVLVVQHMPAGFTKHFSESVNKICAVEVKEAETGDAIQSGRVIIAAGGCHLSVIKRPRGFEVVSQPGENVSGHCPSVDVLMQSASENFGNSAVGVMLTGMGRDGTKGMLSMFRVGTINIAQDETSCVVYGMPKSAVEAGAVHEVTPLDKITDLIMKKVRVIEKK